MVGNPSVYVLHSWNAYRVGCFFVCEARSLVRIVPYKTEKVTIKVQNIILATAVLPYKNEKVTPKAQNAIHDGSTLQSKKVTPKVQNTILAMIFLPEASEKLTLKVQNVHTCGNSTRNSKKVTLKVQKYHVSCPFLDYAHLNRENDPIKSVLFLSEAPYDFSVLALSALPAPSKKPECTYIFKFSRKKCAFRVKKLLT